MTAESQPRLGSLIPEMREWAKHDGDPSGWTPLGYTPNRHVREWCDDLDAALTALRTQIAQLEQEMRCYAGEYDAGPLGEDAQPAAKWVDILRDLQATLMPPAGPST
jgi:hypothetical protein